MNLITALDNGYRTLNKLFPIPTESKH